MSKKNSAAVSTKKEHLNSQQLYCDNMSKIFVLYCAKNGDFLKAFIATEGKAEKEDKNALFFGEKSFPIEDFAAFKIFHNFLPSFSPFWHKIDINLGSIVPWPKPWAIRINFQTGLPKSMNSLPTQEQNGAILLVLASQVFVQLDEETKDKFNAFLSVLKTILMLCEKTPSASQQNTIMTQLQTFRTMVRRQKGNYIIFIFDNFLKKTINKCGPIFKKSYCKQIFLFILLSPFHSKIKLFRLRSFILEISVCSLRCKKRTT